MATSAPNRMTRNRGESIPRGALFRLDQYNCIELYEIPHLRAETVSNVEKY